MSYPSFGPDDPLSRDTLAAIVSAVRPDWRLLDAEPMPEGSDIVYGVTVATGSGESTQSEREAVLKCFRTSDALSFRTHERFLVEVDLLELAGRETDLPVPEVYGVCESHDELPAPAFLMERLPGESVSGVPVGDNQAVVDRLVRESGRYLARIHDLRTFEEFGDLVTGSADPNDGPGPDEPVVQGGRDDWVDRLRDIVAFALDDLDGTRFADLEGDLRVYVDDRLDNLTFDAEPVLLHGDYRPGNLLADPDTGEVTAILDWGASQAGDRRYELAWVVREFSKQAPLDSPVRERVRETLFDAYEREGGVAFDRDEAFERRQRFYQSVTWICELQWFGYWWAGADESTKEARAAQLRENVEALL
ncbi:phosphotransferase family protein [Halosimplex amylolyticum]|uniref:phosphotransferase family protein n=1 Tax=Halosimplex amylolyticum TaxID=3396616 RepID=UPI003F55DCE6